MKPEDSIVQAQPQSLPSVYASQDGFMAAQRMAQSLAASTMVPPQYQGQQGLANCIVALELAHRLGTSPLMVMQNVQVIHGRPSWSSSFLIGLINSCGRFSRLQFVYDNPEDPTSCYAVAADKASGEVLRGTTITLDMANREGWATRSGSKWKTMPGQMLMYRAASFWARAYASDLTLGMRSQEEVIDVEEVTVAPAKPQPPVAPVAIEPLTAEQVAPQVVPVAAPESEPASPPDHHPAHVDYDPASRTSGSEPAPTPAAEPEPEPPAAEPAPTSAWALDPEAAADLKARFNVSKAARDAYAAWLGDRGLAARTPVLRALTCADDYEVLLEYIRQAEGA